MFSQQNKRPFAYWRQCLSIGTAVLAVFVGSQLIWAGLNAPREREVVQTLPGVSHDLLRCDYDLGNDRQRVTTKRIEELKSGDLVLAKDPETGKVAAKRVLRTVRRVSDHVRVLHIRDNSGAVQELRTTDNHPFWVPHVGWKQAGDLTLGDAVCQPDDTSSRIITSYREPLAEGINVFNFEVEQYHSYFACQNANASPIFVHNGVDCLRPGSRGSAEVQDHIDQVRDDFQRANPDYKHTHGGNDAATGLRLKEEYIPGPGGGRKGSARPDLTFEGPTGDKVRINTVDTYSDGRFTDRETKNMDRIFDLTGGETVIGIPKPK